MQYPGSASASWSIGGNTASASASSSPLPNPSYSESGTGITTLTKTVALSGWDGEFTITYTGSITTDAIVIRATVSFAAPSFPKAGKKVQITRPCSAPYCPGVVQIVDGPDDDVWITVDLESSFDNWANFQPVGFDTIKVAVQ